MIRERFRRNSKLDDPIDKVLVAMTVFDADSGEYERLLDHLERLKKMRVEESPLPSGDTWAIVLGNLVGIVAILKFEQANVLVSKSLGMLLRTKHTN